MSRVHETIVSIAYCRKNISNDMDHETNEERIEKYCIRTTLAIAHIDK
jgi:hypothetical protein